MIRSRTVVVVATLLVVPGCFSRGRPQPRTTPVTQPAGTRLADTLEAFALARAGDDIHVLAMSGGGQNGAFGAGVLDGWRSVARPVFDVVTGVSAGALIATHAFLGTPADDEALRATARDTRQSDVYCPRSLIWMPMGTCPCDFRPLASTLARTISNDTIDRVAAASKGGRRLLLVATTNVDAGELTIWDLGALARARAYDRYRAVLLASATPPVAAAPVFLDGVMHADGSMMSNVFVPNPERHLTSARVAAIRALALSRAPGRGTRVTVHVLMNGILGNTPTCVESSPIAVGGRTFDLMLSSASIGALWQLYGITERGGGSVRFTSIPESLRPAAKDFLAFEPASMRALYDAGVTVGRDPSTWRTEPPTIAGN